MATRKTAKQWLKEGKKITHFLFMPGEFVYFNQERNSLVDESGILLSLKSFFIFRRETYWDEGWEIYKEHLIKWATPQEAGTQKDAIQWLAEGERIKHQSFKPGEYIYSKQGQLYNHESDNVNSFQLFDGKDIGWDIYQTPTLDDYFTELKTLILCMDKTNIEISKNTVLEKLQELKIKSHIH